MMDFEIKVSQAFDTTYLRIDLGNLDLLNILCSELGKLNCVKNVNISPGKREHLSVYIHKFVDFNNAAREIEQFLANFDDTHIGTTKSMPIKAHNQDLVTTDNNTKHDSRKPILMENNTAKTNIETIFGNIPTNRPVVFISYAWGENQRYKSWVKKLSDTLRTEYGIYTLLDQYLRAGEDLLEFMIRGIDISHRVIIVGTPEYKEKVDQDTKGGVFVENKLINIAKYQGNKAKFIPVLADGTFDTSFSQLMSVCVGYDLSKEENYNNNLKKLAAEIYNEPINEPPQLGSIPDFVSMVVPTSELISESPIMMTPQNSASYKGEKWLQRLLESFSFGLMDQYFQDMPQIVHYGVVVSHDYWTGILNNTTFKLMDTGLYDVIKDFYDLWHKITLLGGQHFSPSKNPNYYSFFGLKGDIFISSEYEKVFNGLVKDVLELQKKYKSMADYIKQNYPDIDLEETSQIFENSVKNI